MIVSIKKRINLITQDTSKEIFTLLRIKIRANFSFNFFVTSTSCEIFTGTFFIDKICMWSISELVLNKKEMIHDKINRKCRIFFTRGFVFEKTFIQICVLWLDNWTQWSSFIYYLYTHLCSQTIPISCWVSCNYRKHFWDILNMSVLNFILL